ncbi:ER membrane fatty acid alpha-oxygenase Mpo1 [Schizosaccharomyces osmophilus]|uniref:ER membrane fatty acid alpha-oxygenase Mpo1 n=1 Tax=Schizosaccharomyces osmophilus TaxID=2545709 RepID=A0AAE9WBA4_9SCHI|nr:ER membrane fatty acid alpha-oxygenase Mpo1 [Schizosaccharomyces osmophilus]WBW73079.1 ER membrane fatty acid alpha-oxygenase Mpo1 [Schizosaccharomyces osmophilus]
MSMLSTSYRFYAAYHSNAVNIRIHQVCIPLLLCTALILFSNFDVRLLNSSFHVNLAVLIATIYQGFYLCIDFIDGLLYAPALYLYSILLPKLLFQRWSQSTVNSTAIFLHIISWVLQFIGHGVFEKKRPALLDNLVQSIFFAPLFAFLETSPLFGYQPAVTKNIRIATKIQQKEEIHGSSKSVKSESLFDESLLESPATEVSNGRTDITIRPLYLSDINDEYLDLLDVLVAATVRPTLASYQKRFLELKKDFPDTYYTIVVEDKESRKIVGTATLFVERKFIRGNGICAHVEDVVVHPKFQNRSIGKLLIQTLTKLAFILNCYKLILDCSETNVKFYEKCGLNRAGAEMKIYNDLLRENK